MSHVTHDKNKTLARIRRIRGQAEALERAFAQENESASILQQIAAIRGAINGLLMVVLERQLHEHESSSAPAKQHHLQHKQLMHLLKICLK